MTSRESGRRRAFAAAGGGRVDGGVGRFAAGAALGALGCAAWLAAGTATAADHRDSPSQLANPQADINDIYVFMNPSDGEELVLVMTVVQNAGGQDADGNPEPTTFSTTINYDFLIESSTVADATPVDNYRLRCTFPTETRVSCSLGDITATSDVEADGQTLPEGGMRVYAGLREDPFFFNGPGLNALLPAETNVANLPPSGDPEEVFAAAAMTNASGEADSFAGENTLALVIGVDRGLVTANRTAPILKIWAATSPR